MDGNTLCYILFLIVMPDLFMVHFTHGLETVFEAGEEKIDLRRELDKMTQDLLVMKDPFYHSYVFNSGVGNREKLVVEWMRRESQFTAGEAVIGWQSVRNMDKIYLLGRGLSSVTLITAATQLSFNGSTQFHQNSISFEANVTSTSLFTRWNPETLKPEVIAVVAIDTPAADIVFHRIVNGRLEYITQWSRHRKISCLIAVSVNGKNQLIVIDSGTPAVIDVFYVIFTSDSRKFDIRSVQSFAVAGECKSITVCRAGGQHYLILPLAQNLVVYQLVSGRYHKHGEFSIPKVSQMVCFNVALQTYLAVNGESAHVLRITEGGGFVAELMPGYVTNWLALPVSSYRSDVLLLSRAANLTKAYVWGGANRGFDPVTIPHCDSCLEGDWSGATSVPFHHHNCVLIPRSKLSSSLVTVGTSLYNNNPVLDKLNATVTSMRQYQDEWQQIKSKIAEFEEKMQHVVKRNGTNVITGKWKIEKMESQRLSLSSLVKPQTTTNTSDVSGAMEGEGQAGPKQLEAVEAAVQRVLVQGEELIRAVEQREKQVWGLNGFRGKVTFKGRLVVDNLTISHLNHESMDQILHNTFRKDKPEPIQQIVVVHSLEVEDIVVKKINNFTSDNLKFSDGPVKIRGNVTFENPLTVKGNVELKNGGKLNGVDLSQKLCSGEELCSVFPKADVSEAVDDVDLNNNIDKAPTSFSEHAWSHTIAGQNLTVMKINGVDWKTLTQNVVYKDAYQSINGTVVVRGKVSSVPAILADSIQYLHTSQSRASDSSNPFPILKDPQPGKGPASSDRKILDDLPTDSDWVVSELEVIGTVSCDESEWGEEAVDVVLKDSATVVIEGDKTLSGEVSVTNNAQVEGTVGGVNVTDLLTKDTDQVFYGPTTLHGVVTLENVTLAGLWNGKNVSDVGNNNNMSGREVKAESINVLETINGISVSDFIFTENDDVLNVKLKTMNAETIYVTKNIVINGKINNIDLDDFNERRLSLQKEQNISGKVLIKKAQTTGFQVEKVNGLPLSSLFGDSDDSETVHTLHLSELKIEGDITTDKGVNGFNLTDVSANAVWLDANNEIEGTFIFKDEISFDLLECEGFCNNKMCDYWLRVDDVVYKHNKSIILSGKKKFINILNISEDLTVPEINGHKMEDVLTKTTDQEIVGDLSVSGDIRIAEDSVVKGLLNGQNLTEFGQRCTLSGNTIVCKGNTVFKDSVAVQHFNSSGKINGIKFNSFLKSVVRTDDPQQITGFKKFSGNTKVESIEDLDRINEENWDDFLKDLVYIDSPSEHVNHPVTFTETLTLEQLSVDYHIETDTVNGINMTEWKTDAVYINESRFLEREIRLASASSQGNLFVDTYDNLNLEIDIVKLHLNSQLPSLKAKTVTVLGDVEVMGPVNRRHLADVQKNTLKISGDQTITSGLGVMGETVINGSLQTHAPVNQRNLQDIVTLASDQTLYGKYDFDCVEVQENISTSEMISGINLTSWIQTGVRKGGEQEVSGVWRVQGPLELKGPVAGRGRLAGVSLQQLTDNITRDLLDVHRQMKGNLTEACEEANALIAAARNQTCELQYLDVTQTMLVPSGVSLVAHFKSSDEDFLVISENTCTTTIYKWNKNTGTFESLHREMFGYSLKKFIILNYEHLTYVVTESSDDTSNCEFKGKHLWIFMKDHFKPVSPVNFFYGDILQGEKNTLYVVNSSGMFKYALQFDITEGKAFFKPSRHSWNISTGTDVPKEWTGVMQYNWLPEIYTASNCSGDVISVSVDPGRQFVAIASTEAAQVPRYADYIKVYRQDGLLFDKLPAKRVRQLQWLPVPAQTWLVTLQNYSSLNLYQLQGPLLGFQLQLSATVDASNMTTVALPLSSKVNPQPFIILQLSKSVKILRAFLQGDPYLEKDLSCSYGEVLTRVPRN